MSVRCPKCQAGMTALHRHIEYLADGQRVDVVSCKLCGQRLAQRPVVETIQPLPARRVRPEKINQWGENERKPCAVLGCSGHYFASRLPLCGLHAKQLSNWQACKTHRLPPPVALIDGQWREREAPSEVVAPPEMSPAQPKPKPAKQKARAKAKAKPKPTLKQKDQGGVDTMLAQLKVLANRGDTRAADLLARIGDITRPARGRKGRV